MCYQILNTHDIERRSSFQIEFALFLGILSQKHMLKELGNHGLILVAIFAERHAL